MIMRIVHSTPARLVRALAGSWLFVEGSVAQGLLGIAFMTAGTVLIVAAGANVCVLDAVFRRARHHTFAGSAARHPANRSGDTAVDAPVSRVA
jgi:hypothetical protein